MRHPDRRLVRIPHGAAKRRRSSGRCTPLYFKLSLPIFHSENTEKVLCEVFQFLHFEFETRWKNLSASNRNVAAAGEITRQIDSNRNKIIQRFSLGPELSDP